MIAGKGVVGAREGTEEGSTEKVSEQRELAKENR